MEEDKFLLLLLGVIYILLNTSILLTDRILSNFEKPIFNNSTKIAFYLSLYMILFLMHIFHQKKYFKHLILVVFLILSMFIIYKLVVINKLLMYN